MPNRINIKNYSKAVEESLKVIKKGGLVVFPSDTVYGLAVDPQNSKAVAKLLKFKERWVGKAISICVADKKMTADFVEMTPEVEKVIDNLLPGPFTVVADGKHRTAEGIEAENGTLGFRIPNNQFMVDLTKRLGKPFTSTSANLSGKTPHYSVESFWNTLSQKKKEMIDLVVDGGKLPKNKPSTVIDVRGGEIEVLRRGDLLTGKTENLISKSEEETGKIAEFIVNKILRDKGSKKPLVLALTGDLGGGKTVFSRAVGNFLGVKDKIVSPTFVIFNEYKTGKPFCDNNYALIKFLHFDLYRLSESQEFEEISFIDQFEPGVVACIEWPENMGEIYVEKLKEKVNWVPILFEYVDEGTREIRIKR